MHLERCNSHNTFKCYGQCGTENCNTHFQTESGLVDHLKQLLTCGEVYLYIVAVELNYCKFHIFVNFKLFAVIKTLLTLVTFP